MHASSVGCLRRCAEFHEEIGEEVNEGGDHSGSFRSEQSPLPILATPSMQMQESRLYNANKTIPNTKEENPCHTKNWTGVGGEGEEDISNAQ